MTGTDLTFNQKLRTGEASFTDPIFVEALRPYEQMVAAGWLTGDELNLGYADLQQTFLDGAAAMYPMGSFFAGAVPMDHPFEIGIFPMPSLDGTKRLATYTSGGPAISARTPDPENELWIQAQEMLAGRSAEDAAQALQDAWDDLSG